MFATKRVRLAAAALAMTVLGGGAAVASTTACASPAHHNAPLTLNRINLKGFVVNAKYTLGTNTGNTFQQVSETSPVSTQTRVDDSIERRVATVGRVGPHIEVKVIDPATGLTVPRNAPGELCTRGYSVMLGYWRQPDKTSEVIDAARWMHTGDLAVMDDDGYLSITGRIKDMVIRGGENIYPREVEEFLYTHPDILDAQVIGVPDQKYGEELMAWIRLRPGATPITAESLREFCTGKLAHYKIPRYVHITDEFPMTVTGKVRKVEMREKSVEILSLPQ